MVISLTEKKSLRKVWSGCYLWCFPYYLVGADIVSAFSFGNPIELNDNGNETLTRSVIKPTNDLDKRILQGRELIELTGAEGNQVASLHRTMSTSRGTLLGDIMWLAVIAFVFAIITGTLG